MHENLPALPAPALTQHPSGNIYFSPQQMQEYAHAARQSALEEARLAAESRGAAAIAVRNDQAALAAEEIGDEISVLMGPATARIPSLEKSA